MQTFCFEVWRAGKWLYVGKAETTLDDIKREFPHATVEGNTVRLLTVARLSPVGY